MKVITVTEYSKKKGISRQAVLKQIKRGTLKARKQGTQYIIFVATKFKPVKKKR